MKTTRTSTKSEGKSSGKRIEATLDYQLATGGSTALTAAQASELRLTGMVIVGDSIIRKMSTIA